VRYSQKSENSLDLVFFLNGLPIFTAELKNPLTGQNVENAIRQDRFDRDPKEPLFAFGRCLAHFAADPDLVYVTTHLRGPAPAHLRLIPLHILIHKRHRPRHGRVELVRDVVIVAGIRVKLHRFVHGLHFGQELVGIDGRDGRIGGAVM